MLDRIDSTGRAIARTGDREMVLGQFNAIAVAVGTRPVNRQTDELVQARFDVKVIGDASALGRIIGATASEYEAVRSLSL